VAITCQRLEPFVDRPYALFGHSFGALVAFEVARSLLSRGMPELQVLFPSAAPAPHLVRRQRPLHCLPDNELRDELLSLRGTPPELTASDGFMRYLLPVLRADFAVSETYRYMTTPRLTCRIASFAGAHDSVAPPGTVTEWGSATDGPSRAHVLPGDHFFLQTARRHLLRELVSELSSERDSCTRAARGRTTKGSGDVGQRYPPACGE
jgi:medium-chain acyl-[acyl-carrier-protein] hydrolase